MRALAPVPRRRRGIGLEIRPGSVHEARAAAGLSLADVAGTELTRAAIHRVERGLARPSLATLQLIATRTGRALSFFLAEPVSLGINAGPDLERLAARGEFEQVLTRAEDVLADPIARPEARTRAHYWQATAHLRLGRAGPALEAAAAALESLAAEPDQLSVAGVLLLQAQALHLDHDPRSRAVAEAALRAARDLEPPWPLLEARVLATLGALAAERHDVAEATRLFTESVGLVSAPLHDLRGLAEQYENLGVAQGRLGRATSASECFTRAVALYALQSDLAALAAAEVRLAELLMKQGEPDVAGEHVAAALRLTAERGVDLDSRAAALAALGSLQLAKGELEDAEATLLEATALAALREDASTRGAALLSLGRLHTQAGRHKAAGIAFREAIEIAVGLGIPERIREARIDHAASLDRQGRTEEAKDEWMAAALVGTAPEREVASRSSAG